MLDAAAFTDLRGYIKRRIANARYRVGSTYYTTSLNDISILPDGTVRAQLSIIPGGTVTINRVELFNSDGNLWAHQDVSITISTGQTGVLYWFDFTVTEEEV
ncbi:MAG: hypothetical protein K9L62_00495 [Vallitaleaceae bacterium]|nr:hypothetical protein [Vallitaleaceae bacterium]